MPVRYWPIVLLSLAMLFWLGVARAAPPLILSVPPNLSLVEIEKRFVPLAKYLGAILGHEIVVRMPHDYNHNVDVIGRNEVDIAIIGPALLLTLERRHGTPPLLGRFEVNGKSELYGHIFVRHDSPLQTLADLRGKRMVFGPPQSTMSHLVPKAVLRDAGIGEHELGTITLIDKHENIAMGVLAGDYDAGAMKNETFDKYVARGLRSLVELPHVSDYAFVASRRLPADTRAGIRTALANLHKSPEGRAVLNSIQPNLTAIVPVTSSDYDSLRRLLAPPEKPLQQRRP